MVERFMALVLKTSVGQPTGGSNPSLPATMDDYPNLLLNQTVFARYTLAFDFVELKVRHLI